MRKYYVLGIIAFALSSFISASPLNNENIYYYNEEIEIISKHIHKADRLRDELKNKQSEEKRMMARSKDSSLNTEKSKYIQNPNREPIPKNEGIQNLLMQDDNLGRELLSKRKNLDDTSKEFKISLPNRDSFYQESTRKVSLNNSDIYKDYENSTDVVVQSFKDSLRILTVLNGIDSPSEYKYDIKFPPNSEIKKNKDGGIIILNEKGELVIGISSPWAIDSKGKEIPTHYEIRDNSIVQVVKHVENNPNYPIVADPWLWRDLISSANWVKKSEGYTLSVKPTYWARINNGYFPALYGWNELYSKYKNRGLNTNLTSMKNQYICHPLSQVAIFKSTWNLDEWRPNVGLWRTMIAGCNP